jgi:thiamine-phosphate pyrophosphorylase
MRFVLPKIYPLTDRRISGLSLGGQVSRLIKGGAEFIQLREKHLSPRDFLAEAEEALEIAREKRVKILINDRVDLALCLKADGVHLGQDDLPPEGARKILGDAAIIGFSTHNVAQAIEGVKMPIDYIAVGPVFGTKTKENPDPIIGLDGVRAVRDAIGDFPLVAIGGINFENAREVFAAGANSAALVGDLLKNRERITENTRKLIDSYS